MVVNGEIEKGIIMAPDVECTFEEVIYLNVEYTFEEFLAKKSIFAAHAMDLDYNQETHKHELSQDLKTTLSDTEYWIIEQRSTSTAYIAFRNNQDAAKYRKWDDERPIANWPRFALRELAIKILNKKRA